MYRMLGRWLLQLCKDTKHDDDNNDNNADNNNDNNNDDNDDENKNNKPLPTLCDNEGALTHIINGTINARMKHIDVCYHNSRDLHERGIVKYSWVSTQENVTDILTKALPREEHEKFTKALSLW
jgi:hypothetical protein